MENIKWKQERCFLGKQTNSRPTKKCSTGLGCKSCSPGCFFERLHQAELCRAFGSNKVGRRFLWMLGSSGLSGISASALQLGCNIFDQPQVKNSSCGRNQASFVRPESKQGLSPGSQSPEQKHIRFSILGRRSPADEGQEKALSLFVCAMLEYHWCCQSSRGRNL